MTNKKKYVWDIETYPNFFLAVFKVVNSNEWLYFEISDRKNDCNKLRLFLLQEKPPSIGFNNINFDYPVLHNSILSNNKEWTSQEIYKKVEDIIESEYSAVWDNKIKVPQLDLFKIWHYDNKNKSCSLKWLEFAMRMENIEDLPYKPGSILTHNQMDEVILYCNNDIKATEMFYLKSLKHIDIRLFYNKQENLLLTNASETKMAKEIFAKYLSKELNMEVAEVKKLRTFRKSVKLNSVIFDYIKFNDPINNKSLNIFNRFTKTEYNALKFTVPYKNVIREYAEGGLHSFGKSGVYESDDTYIIVDVDFKSYYPHLTFKNNLHPQHIPEKVFNEIYEGFYTEREKYSKIDPRNYVLKILLNSSYGLSKDKYAFLLDLAWQLAVVINGQLILTMLTERIFEKLSYCSIIFENTDGAAYMIKKSELALLKIACKEIEIEVKIPLEIQICKKIIAKDVNNYINIVDDTNIKYKGCYEIDRDFHKNHSKRLVAIGAANYFINGIEPYTTIKNHLTGVQYSFAENYGIFDFCLGSKMKKGFILNERITKGSEQTNIELGKVNRYYVSKTGNQLIKIAKPLEKQYKTNTDKFKENHPNQLNIFDEKIEDVLVEPKDREFEIEAGKKTTLFNKFEIKEDYNLSYNYYIEEINKLIKI